MEEGRLDQAPIWSDLRTFDARAWCGVVDLVVAGIPCQPYSAAGKRRGAADPRDLWPHARRVLADTQPALFFLENVGALLGRGFDIIARDLQALGFEVAATLLRASDVGAPHRRERLFVLAVAHGCRDRLEVFWEPRDHPQSPHGDEPHGDEPHGRLAPLAHADHSRSREAAGGSAPLGHADLARSQGWSVAHETRPRSGDGRGGLGPALLGSSDGQGRPALSHTVGFELRNEQGRSERPSRSNAPIARTTCLPWTAPWPPRPLDVDGWREYLRIFPSLEPSFESPLRGSVAGLPHRLDRVDRLRALGNAVIPEQGAAALKELAEVFR